MLRPGALAALTIGMLATGSAHAADAGTEVAELEREITLAHSQLTQKTVARDECEAACRALGSMRRATDRLCVLEPGPRCADARRRTTDAENLVRESCPWCAGAQDQVAVRPQAGSSEKGDTVTAERPPSPASPVHDAAPERGGCRSCATASAPDAADFATFAAGLLGVLAARRARKKKRDGL